MLAADHQRHARPQYARAYDHRVGFFRRDPVVVSTAPGPDVEIYFRAGSEAAVRVWSNETRITFEERAELIACCRRFSASVVEVGTHGLWVVVPTKYARALAAVLARREVLPESRRALLAQVEGGGTT